MPFILQIVRSRRHPRHTTHIPSPRKLFMSLLSSSFQQVSLLAIDIPPPPFPPQSSSSIFRPTIIPLLRLAGLLTWHNCLTNSKSFNQTTIVLLFSKEDTTVAGSVTKRCACPQPKLHRNPWNPKVPPLYLSSDLTCSCVTTEHLLSPSVIQPRKYSIDQAPGHHSPILFVSQVSSGIFANLI